jgi:zinc protease
MNRLVGSMYKKVFIILIIGILFGIQTRSDGQEIINIKQNDTVLPQDPQVKIAKLENGLTYYVRENKKPENRAEIRLVVSIGSVVEEEHEQGIAHFLEHMAFNGTKNFKKQELVDYLESIGMRFGPDLNAYTSFDETVYELQVPTDSLSILKSAFQILEDWAHLVSLDTEAIDKERGVIKEEWRLRRGASARIGDQKYPIYFYNSQYAKRLPIGKMEIIDNCPSEVIRQFYRKWYRPQHMAVIAVGDFDKQFVENLIKIHFSKLETGNENLIRPIYIIPDHEKTLFTIATDPEMRRTNVSLNYKHDVNAIKTITDYKQMLIEDLYNQILNQRFQEILQQPDPPFLYAFSFKGSFVKTKDIYSLEAGVQKNEIGRALESLVTESERVKRHGFTSSELERVKREKMRLIEKAFNERDKTESNRYANEYIRNFLYTEPAPGIEYEYEMYKLFVPRIELDEINHLGDRWIRQVNRVIAVEMPEKVDIKVPSEDELVTIISSAEAKEIQPYVDQVLNEPLLDEFEEIGSIIEQDSIVQLGLKQLTLSNGIRVVLKSTEFKNDEIRFTALSPGGHSLVDAKDYLSAITATSIIQNSGIGKFSSIELEKALTGKLVNVAPWIGELQEGISGSVTPEDLETLFQLIYLYFTEAKVDSTSFLSYKNRMKGSLENRSVSPDVAFRDTIQVTMSQNHPRRQPWTKEKLDQMDMVRSYEIYQDRFADVSDFIFIFVGNFEADSIEYLLTKYLGTLPAINRKEKGEDVGAKPPKGVINKYVKRGIEDKSSIQVVFTGQGTWSRENSYNLSSMASVLRIKLREVLREDLGGTYGVGVGASQSRIHDQYYRLTISFGCAPDRVEELTNVVFSQIDSLKNYPVEERYLKKVKETQRRSYERSLKENTYWLNNLAGYFYFGDDPRNIYNLNTYMDKLSQNDILQSAKQYFDMNNYVRFVLLPEKTN